MVGGVEFGNDGGCRMGSVVVGEIVGEVWVVI